MICSFSLQRPGCCPWARAELAEVELKEEEVPSTTDFFFFFSLSRVILGRQVALGTPESLDPR